MKQLSCSLLLCWLLICGVVSCGGGDSESYPSIITEMVVMKVDGSLQVTIYTDGGSVYRVSNQLSGLRANSMGRGLCGYVPDASGTASLYTYQGIRVLPNYTERVPTLKTDPVDVVSSWRGSSFINLHLKPKTYGDIKKHEWAFVKTAECSNSAGGSTYQLSLYHDSKGDAQAYSTDLYLCLSLDSVNQDFAANDSVELSIEYFDGLRTLKFGK